MTTAYHPQADGQSERINQTVEIGIRQLLSQNPDMDFVEALPWIQSGINNSISAATGLAPNQVVYGMPARDNLALLRSEAEPNWDIAQMRTFARKQAADSIAWSAIDAKYRFDSRHLDVNLQVGDQVYLRLHHGYSVPGLVNRKFTHQRTGPFMITRKVGRLAYKPELPDTMKIHPVISVTQLEPAADGEDPFHRRYFTKPPPVFSNLEDLPDYEMERLLAKRYRLGEPEYLVKWVGFGHEHNQWYPVAELRGAQDIIDAYEDSQQSARAVATRKARGRLQRKKDGVPRPRGRPRKIPLEQALAEQQKRRPRGRPRKNPVPITQDSARSQPPYTMSGAIPDGEPISEDVHDARNHWDALVRNQSPVQQDSGLITSLRDTNVEESELSSIDDDDLLELEQDTYF